MCVQVNYLQLPVKCICTLLGSIFKSLLSTKRFLDIETIEKQIQMANKLLLIFIFKNDK